MVEVKELDSSDAPKGCKAVPFTSCTKCHFVEEANCEMLSHSCMNYVRPDGNSVMFVPLRAEELPEKVKGEFKNKGFPKFMKGNPNSEFSYDGVVCFVDECIGFAISGKSKREGMVDNWISSKSDCWLPYTGNISLKYKG